MVDLARLLAARGHQVTVVTTPVNAARNRAARRAGLAVELAELPFPGSQLGLLEVLENLDQLVDKAMYIAFFRATWKMAEPLREYVRALPRRPDCLVADSCNPWTAGVCTGAGIPRLVLHCQSAYFQLAVHKLSRHGVYDRAGVDETEPFEAPDLPVRAVGSKATLRGFLTHCGWNATLEAVTHGVPALTWPCFADQFCSENLLVDELGVGVRSGAKVPAMYLPEEAEGVQVTRRDVERAISELMEGAACRRSRAREVAEEARAAMEEGGSSYSDLMDMIRHVSELSRKRSHDHEGETRARPPMVLHCLYSPKL